MYFDNKIQFNSIEDFNYKSAIHVNLKPLGLIILIEVYIYPLFGPLSAIIHLFILE